MRKRDGGLGKCWHRWQRGEGGVGEMLILADKGERGVWTPIFGWHTFLTAPYTIKALSMAAGQTYRGYFGVYHRIQECKKKQFCKRSCFPVSIVTTIKIVISHLICAVTNWFQCFPVSCFIGFLKQIFYMYMFYKAILITTIGMHEVTVFTVPAAGAHGCVIHGSSTEEGRI